MKFYVKPEVEIENLFAAVDVATTFSEEDLSEAPETLISMDVWSDVFSSIN